MALHPQTVRKVSAVLHKGTTPSSTTARHGTVTLNQAPTHPPVSFKGIPANLGPAHHGVATISARPIRNTPKGPTKGKGTPPGASGARTTAGATSHAAAATPPGGPSVSPFLTPAQQAALSKYDTRYNTSDAAMTRNFGDLTVRTNAGLANAQKTHDVNTSMTNQNAAARGLFQSSIRDGDLNDIDTALVTRTGILNTALNNAYIDMLARRTANAADYATTHTLYDDQAVANAAATPVSPSASPTTGGSQPAPTGTAAAAGGQQPTDLSRMPAATQSLTQLPSSVQVSGFGTPPPAPNAEFSTPPPTTITSSSTPKPSSGPAKQTGTFPKAPGF